MTESRTMNSIKNFSTGLLMQLFNKILAFVCRTVFIFMLNAEYLGINGLFTNILSVLSFAELGIGTAIIFSMYKPVANDDKEKIKSLLSLYKKSYCIIGFVIFFLGILLIPFLSFLVKDVPNIHENINLLYFLFLINTVISYFYAYKKTIISAYQKERILNRVNSLFYLICNIIQIFVLFLTHNYIMYLIVQIVMTLLENIYISNKANKLFPFILDKNVKKIEKKETKKIFNDVKDLTVYKFGSVIISSTDNIIISAIIDVKTVGLCSNYVLIIESVRSVFNSAFNGITASIGNLNVNASANKKESVLLQYNFVCFWIYSFCAISFVVLLNPFIKLWLGEEYLLSNIVSFALAFSFWIVGIRSPAYTYRITLGMFNKGKMAPYLCSVFNIVLSIFLGKLIGVAGVFLATSISQILTYSWMDPYFIYKYDFKISIVNYIKKHLNYIFIFFIVCFIVYFLSSLVNISVLYDLIIKFIITLFVTNILLFIFTFKSYEYKEVKNKLLVNLKNRKKRKEII